MVSAFLRVSFSLLSFPWPHATLVGALFCPLPLFPGFPSTFIRQVMMLQVLFILVHLETRHHSILRDTVGDSEHPRQCMGYYLSVLPTGQN